MEEKQILLSGYGKKANQKLKPYLLMRYLLCFSYVVTIISLAVGLISVIAILANMK